MTQRVFDIENEKDMVDLWNILPDDVVIVVKDESGWAKNYCKFKRDDYSDKTAGTLFNINWHNKTEITRPIQEATKQDVDKLCVFWNDVYKEKDVGILAEINGIEKPYRLGNELADGVEGIELWYDHCRRLTKQEIEELI